MAQINWNSKEVIEVISNPNLSVRQMSEILGKDIFSISRHRSKLGLPRLHSASGLDRPMTNAERKQRYNVKLKANGWKPLSSKTN